MTAFIASAALRSAWHPVAESDDVTDGPLAVTLLGRALVLWRSGGSIVAAPDRCPHREAPLSIGRVTDGVLACGYHGWSFGAAGACVSIPSSGATATIPPTAHLPCVEVRERYGLVWIRLESGDSDLPEIPQESDPAFRRINSGMQRWAVSTPRMVDNFCDVSHFPWVHVGTFGEHQDPVVDRVELDDLDHGWFGYEYEVEVANPEAAESATGVADAVVRRRMSTGFHLPFDVRSTIRYETGLEHVLLLCSTPVDDETSLFTFVVWRNDDHGSDPEAAIAFDRAIGAEDQRLLEQIPGTMPLHRKDLVSVQADRCSVEWRRRVSELLGPA
jgi:phenylpropionate dioxygenase-like ring-hydroxylating dioxygenase large terminal subunit